MAHKPQEEITQALSIAAEKIEIGADYVHYKDPTKLYKVKGFVVIEATDEVAVLYEAQYGRHITFVRPLTSWLETVEQNGKLVPRFAKISVE